MTRADVDVVIVSGDESGQHGCLRLRRMVMPQVYQQHRDFESYPLLHIAALQSGCLHFL